MKLLSFVQHEAKRLEVPLSGPFSIRWCENVVLSYTEEYLTKNEGHGRCDIAQTARCTPSFLSLHSNYEDTRAALILQEQVDHNLRFPDLHVVFKTSVPSLVDPGDIVLSCFNKCKCA